MIHPHLSLRILAAGLLTTLIGACAVGPNYSRPPLDVPTTFKSATTQESQPTHLASNWWLLFDDPYLTSLEESATQHNPDLQAAMARVAEARAASSAVAGDFYPQITMDASAIRARATGRNGSNGFTANDIRIPFDLTYEIDIWGRVRRSYEASRAQLQASSDDYAVVLQTLQADVAQNYLNLRSLDAQDAIYIRSVEVYRRQLDLTQRERQAGIKGAIDVVQVQALLQAAISLQIDTRRQRADTEHALAILVGRPPAEFSLESDLTPIPPPAIPAGLPAELLAHRPDVASAEQNLAAASAQIGVATANFYPVVRLTGAAGYESIDVQHVLDWEARIWSLGPSINLPIFEGGKLTANLKQARSHYDELLATYKSTLLGAFRDVEDSLTDVHFRSDALESQNRAVTAAREYVRLSELENVQGGILSTLQVLDADRVLLLNELAQAQLLNQRLISTVLLIKALGGGWDPKDPVSATQPLSPAPK